MKKMAQISVFIALAALLLTGGILAQNFYTHPVNEPMQVQISEKQAPAPMVAGVHQTKLVQKTETCGQSGMIRLLFVGANQLKTPSPFGAESVRMVKVDYDQKKVVVVVFPRDMLLNTPALSDLNLSESRLGPAYYYRYAATKGEEKHRMTQATELVAQTLYDNFAYPSTKKDYYYFDLRLEEMGKMIDTIGGVEITLPEAFTNERNITFPAGPQTLNGELSIEFNNSLKPGGDPARIARQNLFAKALQAKALRMDVLVKVPELYKQFNQAIMTDLSPKQIESLACMAKGDPQVTISMREIGVENGLVTVGADGALVPNVEKIKAALKDWFED